MREEQLTIAPITMKGSQMYAANMTMKPMIRSIFLNF